MTKNKVRAVAGGAMTVNQPLKNIWCRCGEGEGPVGSCQMCPESDQAYCARRYPPHLHCWHRAVQTDGQSS